MKPVKMHYNWKFPFLRPSIEEVVARYNQKWPRGKLNNTGLHRSSPRPRLLLPLLQTSLVPLEPNAQTELREVWAG